MRFLTSGLAVLLAATACPAVAQEFEQSMRRACSADGVPEVAGLELRDVAAVEGDLPGIRVTDAASGAFMQVYFQPGHEAAARSRAACLGGQLRLLRQALNDDRRDTEWFAVVFADEDYAPPRQGEMKRWSSPPAPETDAFVTQTMPHEQVHGFQSRAGATTPRWFHEGHAVWIAGKINPLIRPDLAAVETRMLEEALAGLVGPPLLRTWGAVRVKPEAIRRQVSPEMRARMDADPSFTPPGPFKFEPGDIESDQSNNQARYAAAGNLFAGLEARHGAEAVQAWVNEMTASEGRVSNTRIRESALRLFGEDIGPLLE